MYKLTFYGPPGTNNTAAVASGVRMGWQSWATQLQQSDREIWMLKLSISP